MTETINVKSIKEALSEIENNANIICSKLQTKKWRQSQSWYKMGKSNECETYQKNKLKSIIGQEILKTNDRIYMETNVIKEKANPLHDLDGFEWTENFDGKIKKSDKTIYFNLKFICDTGGAQTRSLREVYHFIKCQLQILNKNPTQNIYFVNILDGNCCHKHIKKFKTLIKKYAYLNHSKLQVILNNIYCGDLYKFSNWWKSIT
jgi:hypothetical protein